MRNALLAALLLEGIAGAAELRITVYDRANLTEARLRPGFESVERMFRRSGLQITWTMGSLESEEASLLTYPQRPARGRERQASCAARRDIALELLPKAPEGFNTSLLGMAQPLATEGVNVRVFNDRVERAAMREGRPHLVVLAHVIAHEIGHVLLRTTEHGPSGMMAAVWGQEEYRRMGAGVLGFTAVQGRAMEREVTGEECGMARLATPANSTPHGIRAVQIARPDHQHQHDRKQRHAGEDSEDRQ